VIIDVFDGISAVGRGVDSMEPLDPRADVDEDDEEARLE
jgi:hypothetical protein